MRWLRFSPRRRRSLLGVLQAARGADPRASLSERYAAHSRAARYAEASATLRRERLLLPEDDHPLGRCRQVAGMRKEQRMIANAADVVELNQLAFRYAAGVDSTDTALFLSVFAPHARLRAYQPGSETAFTDLTGHDQLAAIPEAMRGMYRATTHMMTNHLVAVAGDTAAGEVLCTARQCTLDGTASHNVIIRYRDRYVRQGGNWLIEDREIRFLWSESHPVAEHLIGS
jgi:hypothetical protein